jgi:hypothetical protein
MPPRLNIEKLIEVLMRVSDGLYACWQASRNDELTESISVERNRLEVLIRSLERLVDDE